MSETRKQRSYELGFWRITWRRIRRDPMAMTGLIIVGTLFLLAWIAPVLASLSETPLMLGAMGLTAFNDNAAITYLATLVPNFSDSMK